MKFAFHLQQTLGFFFGQLEDWDAGRNRQHFSNQFLIHNSSDVHVAGLPFALALSLFEQQVLFGVAQSGGLFKVLRIDC
ncbi:unannotated protein [freshwater metagenome]|uniref:Unannotated protein n=1 Tax=freshwater metagenome TaxID=449393 RepID=A0A6J6VPE3_9ZZZZ